jgi:hypothetical protein
MTRKPQKRDESGTIRDFAAIQQRDRVLRGDHFDTDVLMLLGKTVMTLSR